MRVRLRSDKRRFGQNPSRTAIDTITYAGSGAVSVVLPVAKAVNVCQLVGKLLRRSTVAVSAIVTA